MAFLKDNFYEEGNSEEFFAKRNNPLANSANAEILKVESCGSCAIELDIAITTSAGTTTVVLNAPTNAYDAVMVHITDGKGNFVTGSGAGAIDTSSLDSSATWTVTVYIESGTDKALNCVCSKKYTFDYVPADGVEINTETIGIGILRASATVGGTYNLETLAAGAFADGGTTETFEFFVKNVGVNALQVDTITVDGDLVSAVFETTLLGADTLLPTNIRKISSELDSSGAAGAYTGDVIFTYTDGTTQSITINYTLA